jgi:glycosyltransferase involved in cell wall biosynthesis
MRLRAAHLGVSDRVEFLGHLTDVAREYAWADVVLSCSAHESFGLSLVEGAASGCAVVATDTGVARDLCVDEGDGPGGLLVGREPRSVAGALESLAVDPRRCHALGANARRRASRFTWDAMAAATERIYAQLAAGELA